MCVHHCHKKSGRTYNKLGIKCLHKNTYTTYIQCRKQSLYKFKLFESSLPKYLQCDENRNATSCNAANSLFYSSIYFYGKNRNFIIFYIVYFCSINKSNKMCLLKFYANINSSFIRNLQFHFY